MFTDTNSTREYEKWHFIYSTSTNVRLEFPVGRNHVKLRHFSLNTDSLTCHAAIHHDKARDQIVWKFWYSCKNKCHFISFGICNTKEMELTMHLLAAMILWFIGDWCCNEGRRKAEPRRIWSLRKKPWAVTYHHLKEKHAGAMWSLNVRLRFWSVKNELDALHLGGCSPAGSL